MNQMSWITVRRLTSSRMPKLNGTQSYSITRFIQAWPTLRVSYLIISCPWDTEEYCIRASSAFRTLHWNIHVFLFIDVHCVSTFSGGTDIVSHPVTFRLYWQSQCQRCKVVQVIFSCAASIACVRSASLNSLPKQMSLCNGKIPIP